MAYRAAARSLVALAVAQRARHGVVHRAIRSKSSAARHWLSAPVLAGFVALARCNAKDSDAQKAESMYRQNKPPKEIYNFILEAVQRNTSDELLWRLARACHDLAAEISDKEQKKRLISQGFQAAQQALQLNSNNFACHKWMAIMYSDIGDFEGTKAKLLNAYTMRDHFVKAIELNRTDATSHHLLGLWCFTFADLSWTERKAASLLFATPPSSSYEEALSHFEAAEQLDPGFYPKNAMMLGKTYLRMSRKDDARQWLNKCLQLEAKNADDRAAHKEAQDLLKKLAVRGRDHSPGGPAMDRVKESFKPITRPLSSIASSSKKSLTNLIPGGDKFALAEDIELAIVPRKRWIPDAAAQGCMRCSKAFSALKGRRRHHCRCCGQIFCNKCTSLRMTLRVCFTCYQTAKAQGVVDEEEADEGEESELSPFDAANPWRAEVDGLRLSQSNWDKERALFTEELALRDREIAALKEQLACLEAERNLISDDKTKVDSQVAEYEAALADKSKQLLALQNKFDFVNMATDHDQQTISDLQSQCERLTSANQDLELQTAALQSRLEDSQSQVASLEENHSRQLDSLKVEAEGKCESLEDTVTRTAAQAERVSSELKTSLAREAQAREYSQQLEASNSSFASQLEAASRELESSRTDWDQQMIALNEERSQLEQLSKSLEAKAKEQGDQISSLEKVLAGTQEEFEEFKQSAASSAEALTAKVARAANANKALQADLSSVSQERDSLQLELESLSTQLAALGKDEEAKQKQLIKLQDRSAKRESESAGLRVQVELARSGLRAKEEEFEKREEQLQKELEGKKSDIARLKRAIQSLNNDKASLEKTIAELQAQLEAVKHLLPAADAPSPAEGDELDNRVSALLTTMDSSRRFRMERLGPGQYRTSDGKTHMIRQLNNQVMIRVGGGYDTLESYLSSKYAQFFNQ